MRVLLTGARGFLGRHLVDAFDVAGHLVVGPTRDALDLTDPKSINNWDPPPGPVDGIVHAAALVGGLGFVNQDPLRVMATNLAIHLGAVRLAERLGVRWFVGVGSACAYPESELALIEEDLWRGPLHPSVYAYGTTKRALEALQRAWVDSAKGRRSIHAVLANLYGPGDTMEEGRAHAATALTRRFVRAALDGSPTVNVWGSGAAEREFLYVEDAALRLVQLAAWADAQAAGGHEVVNVGSGESTSMRTFVSTLAEVAGYAGQVVWDASAPVGVGRKFMETQRADSRFGFPPTTALREGLLAATLWERSRRESVTRMPGRAYP